MIKPYDEGVEVAEYKSYLTKEEIDRAYKHFGDVKSPSGVQIPHLTSAQIEEYFDYKGGSDEKGYFYWTTQNPNRKWDWYQIGGRWQGMLKLKKGAKGRAGSKSLLDTHKTGDPLGTDIAYLKDVDNRNKFHTYAILDEKGWHDGNWHEADREKWCEKYKERFLSNPTDKTVIAIVDCHNESPRTKIKVKVDENERLFDL